MVNWLYSKPIKKTANNLISLLKSNKIVRGSGKKLSKPKTQKECQNKIMKKNTKSFKLEKENKVIEEKTIGGTK